jgi:hypothetical protein
VLPFAGNPSLIIDIERTILKLFAILKVAVNISGAQFCAHPANRLESAAWPLADTVDFFARQS